MTAKKQSPLAVAIDGPSGAGKSTVAKLLAKRLAAAYLDTGAMYRTVAYCCVARGLDLADTAAVTAAVDTFDIRVEYVGGAQHMYADGTDVSAEIRRHEMSAAASAVSKIAAVRSRLVSMQREIAAREDTVLDGRDIASHVLPDARYKFFLTASSEVRAQRRCEELAAKAEVFDKDAVRRDIEARDLQDTQREISPLVRTEDAILIDSSAMDIAQVVEKMLAYIQTPNN